MVDDETLAGRATGEPKTKEDATSDDADTIAQNSPFAGQSDATAAAALSAGSEKNPPQQQPTEAVPRDAQPTREAGASQGNEELAQRIEAALDKSEQPFVQEDTLLGRTIANRFVIQSKVGAGGMGAVYRAAQLGMDRHVAIKVLLSELNQNPMIVKRFHMEALAVSKLEHPNTIRIFDFGQTTDGVLFIAMEFLNGRSLEHELRSSKTIAIRRTLRIVAQICRSLAEAHDKGIVHRDLKPDNVFLLRVGDDPDFVKVLDFGVAKLKAEDRRMGTLTQAGMVFGTPKHMSPEQSRSDITDARADIYALGVILYEMITGRAPFEADNPLALLIQHVQDDAAPPSRVRPDLVVPSAVESIIMRCLEKDADDRFQTARALAEALEEAHTALDKAFDQTVTRKDAEELGLHVETASMNARDEAFTAHTPGLRKGGQADETTPMTPEEARPLLEAMEKKKRRRRLWLVLALFLLAAGAVATTVLIEPQSPQKRPVAEEPATPTAAKEPQPDTSAGAQPDMVSVTLESNPSGADVFLDGKLVGHTPYDIERSRDVQAEQLSLSLDGYVSRTVPISFERDGTYNLELAKKTPVSSPDVTPKPDTPVAKKPKRPKKPKKPAQTEEPKKPPTFSSGKVDDIK